MSASSAGPRAAAGPRVVVVPEDGSLARALRDTGEVTVVGTASEPSAVAALVRESRVDALVRRHDPAERDATAAVTAAREEVDGLPVVSAVSGAATDLPSGPATDHVRTVGAWVEDLCTRVERLTDALPYERLYHEAGEGLVLHEGETPAVVEANDRLYEMLGYDPSVHDLAIDDIVASDGQFTRERAAEEIQRAFDGDTRTFEWLDDTSDGRGLWVEVTLERVTLRGEPYVLARIRDVDDRKASEREMVVAESRREATLERVSDAFFGLDTDWRFTYLNERAAEVLEVAPDAVRGRSVWEVFPEAVDTAFERHYREALGTQEPTSFEAYFPPLETWFEVNAYPAPDGLSVYFQDVTERKRRERELEAYEQLVENVDEALFVLDEVGRFELVTEPLATWFGRDRAEVEGRAAAPLLAPEADVVAAHIETAVTEGDPVDFETPVVNGEGRAMAAVELTPVPSGAVGSVHDVTAQRARERSHDALIDNVPGMVYRRRVDGSVVADGAGGTRRASGGTGPDGTAIPAMTIASDAAPEVVGRAPSTLTDARTDWLTDVVHPDDREAVAERFHEAVAEGEPFTVTYRITTPSGVRWVRDRARPVVGPDGRVTTVEGLVVDATGETRRERHRQVLMRVLRHNLRNSIQVVRGYAEEITDRADDDGTEPSVASMAATISEQAADLSALSEKARDVEGTISVVRDPDDVDAAALCREVLADRQERHPDATLEGALPDRLRVQAEPDLRRAVDALVENAVVHHDGVAAVRVSAVEPDRDGWVGLRIADDGSGLPERERAVLTGDREITQLVHGRGLGLWLVKWLVESYGGELRIDVGDGTAVTLLLPRA